MLISVSRMSDGEPIGAGGRLKSLSCDRGIPMVKDMRGFSFRRLTPEHGFMHINVPAAVELGEKFEIWALSSNGTVNLHSRMCGIRNGQVEEFFRVEG